MPDHGIADGGPPTTRSADLHVPLRGSLVFVLAMLFIVNVFNFIDRQIPFILADSIKSDLRLTDAQLGRLGVLAVAVVYSTSALPLARIAARWAPTWVMVGSRSVWCLLTTCS